MSSLFSVKRKFFFIPLFLIGIVCFAACESSEKEFILATTTSTENSGLIEALIPSFEKESGYKVKVIAVGTGAALEMGRRGDVDVLLVHAPEAEQQLIDSGFALERIPVMKNWFVIVGPKEDFAEIKDLNASVAFNTIARVKTSFISRGDNSGTHKRELQLWKDAGFDSPPQNESWYLSTGQGMAATLTIASELKGYALTDKGTYLATSLATQLVVLVDGGLGMENIYSVVLLNPEKLNINNLGAVAFRDYMLSEEAKNVIRNFGRQKFGEPLFTPFGSD